MTVGEWLDARVPAPPDALRERLYIALGESLQRDVATAPAVLLAAGERMAAELLRSGSTSRESALDLLAADAFVTYAFEAASDAPGDLTARATQAMARIAGLAAVSPAT